MLYDSRRDKYPELFRFIAWLRGKPRDEKYPWADMGGCACAQFWETANWYQFNSKTLASEGVNFNQLAMGGNLDLSPDKWTWGKLLDRAEDALARVE